MRTPEMTIARAKNAEGREFRAIYLAAFVLFLAAVVVTRFLPPKWRPWPPSADRARSVLAEARAAASAFVPFAMMG